MPCRCFWMLFCSALLAVGILDVFLELHMTDYCDDGVDFSPFFSAFFGLLFGVEAPCCKFMPQLVDINLPRDGRV